MKTQNPLLEIVPLEDRERLERQIPQYSSGFACETFKKFPVSLCYLIVFLIFFIPYQLSKLMKFIPEVCYVALEC